MGKGKRTLVIPSVTDNIFDFFKYAVMTLFALGDREKSRMRKVKFLWSGSLFIAQNISHAIT